ncbi:RNA 3'-terminal phosphate cyclase [Agrilus planipennis]|uniref:RNA 3'-terminal phosphate cyclase n=1 Tax=Agrilus planipennis TaxID=224129 RepID=A0A1W4XAG4_AGRPL|nr:RNA 3'-terminal phosphate cyclase [Agrilus planipennis]
MLLTSTRHKKIIHFVREMSAELIEIDGSLLEGGGQILRVAVTLSAILKTPIRVFNIRAGRSKPGLMEQHLKGLELVRDITNARVIGGKIGSTEIEFWPDSVKGGQYRAAVKTAGSISLLLQVALPCTLFANCETTLFLQGGTNAEMAPQIDYTTEVFRPILEKFGATFDFKLIKRGYFPKGGGEIIVNVKPVKQLRSVEMLEPGNVISIYGWSFVAGSLPIKLAHIMADSATRRLKSLQNNINIERYKESPEVANSNCSGLIIIAETSTGCILGGSALGKRNETLEQTGTNAAEELLTSIQEGACVDKHCQDQIIILMALAKGISKIRVGKITLHTETAIFVAEKLGKVKFEINHFQNYSVIQCNGLGVSSA